MIEFIIYFHQNVSGEELSLIYGSLVMLAITFFIVAIDP